ncbi:MAG: DUF2628 domain-containing protein [Hyphomicrobiaceae bacterium]|nr:DUF2628 domain-containing protein [Hyphomicrobiaceae bacterium]
MITYTVHERATGETNVALRADSIIFVKEGFAWLALFFPLLWMLFNRMWLVLLGFLAVMSVLQAAAAAAGLAEMLAGWITLGASLLFAFHANDLRRWTLARNGYAFAGLVTGRDREECESRFFDGWLAAQEPEGAGGPSVGVTAPTRLPAPQRRPSASDDDVIGLFPEPNT